ncbi:hypothetical protein MSS4_01142 [Mycobacterium marinum]|nr:hypothetical protein MSS2_04826 [Mycobacterium marinum]RFZ52405.1 hypothetical protein MSS4_01142 [Mycobacterium marinum]RFZ66978.1 hypothetical protein DE4576_02327 [Mycobacterium marinum]
MLTYRLVGSRTGKPCPPVTPMKEDADGVSF